MSTSLVSPLANTAVSNLPYLFFLTTEIVTSVPSPSTFTAVIAALLLAIVYESLSSDCLTNLAFSSSAKATLQKITGVVYSSILSAAVIACDNTLLPFSSSDMLI